MIGGNTADAGVTIGMFSADAEMPRLKFLKSRNTAVNSPASGGVIQDDDYLGGIQFHAHDGTDYVSMAASIYARVNGSPGANDIPTDLVFNTCADGAGANVERMRIMFNGGIAIGKSATDTTTTGVSIWPHGPISCVAPNETNLYLRRNSDGDIIQFVNDGSNAGEITLSGTSTSYSTSSDHRLKENIIDLSGAADRVAQLQPRRFNFVADADRTLDGFVAHEVSDIVPEAITGVKDGMRDAKKVIADASGVKLDENIEEAAWLKGKERTLVSEATDEEEAVYADPIYAADTVWHETLSVPKYQGIDQAKLVPLLTAAIQELTARITALESA